MAGINDKFPNVICLNLEHRGDRREASKEEFQKAGLQVKFFRANKGGAAGFCRSMFNIFNSFETDTFVFEDDIQFVNDLSVFDLAYAELPDDWDMIYLGANVREPLQRHSLHLLRLKNAWTSHAVGYSAKMLAVLRDKWDGHLRHPYIYDEWAREFILPNYKCYITDPMLATQRFSYSDITKQDADYSCITESQKYYEHSR